MAKKKGFKDWYEDDEWGRDEKFTKKQNSKKTSKQDKIKQLRRQKNRMKDDFFK
jgi:uncharacterized protein YdcH (DUF465 family)